MINDRQAGRSGLGAQRQIERHGRRVGRDERNDTAQCAAREKQAKQHDAPERVAVFAGQGTQQQPDTEDGGHRDGCVNAPIHDLQKELLSHLAASSIIRFSSSASSRVSFLPPERKAARKAGRELSNARASRASLS